MGTKKTKKTADKPKKDLSKKDVEPVEELPARVKTPHARALAPTISAAAFLKRTGRPPLLAAVLQSRVERNVTFAQWEGVLEQVMADEA